MHEIISQIIVAIVITIINPSDWIKKKIFNKQNKNVNNSIDTQVDDLICELKDLKNCEYKEDYIKEYLTIFSNSANFSKISSNMLNDNKESVFNIFCSYYNKPQSLGKKDIPKGFDYETFQFMISQNDKTKIRSYLKEIHLRFEIDDLINVINKNNEDTLIELKKLLTKSSKKFSNETQNFLRKEVLTSKWKSIYQFTEGEKELINERIEKLEKK